MLNEYVWPNVAISFVRIVLKQCVHSLVIFNISFFVRQEICLIYHRAIDEAFDTKAFNFISHRPRNVHLLQVTTATAAGDGEGLS